MTTITRILFCVFFVLSAQALAEESPDQPPQVNTNQAPPNIILIYIDDLGFGDLGCFGCQDIPTPNIDRLAADGVQCTASYITNPPCCPSRCSMIMGQYGQRFGKYGMSRGLPIPEDRPTLPKFLADNGYATGQIGKWDIGTKLQGPLQVGFNQIAKTPPKKKYTKQEIAKLPNGVKQLATKKSGSKYFCINAAGKTVWLTDYDGDSMVDYVGRHKEQPFFLYWSPEAVHSPSIEAPERLMARTTATGKRRKLAGAIVSVDDQVGKLIKALEKHGLRENTLVIFTSDNGANGGEGGSSAPYTGGKGIGTQKEGWVRVPTIFSMPGTIPRGKTYEGLIANFDFYSTIAVLAGQPIPRHCDGVDLLPFLTGENTGDAHEYLYWLNNEPGDAVRRHLIAARWKDWRLYKKYDKDPWQLFDLKSDPKEERNVAADHPEIVTQMAAKHSTWATTLAPLAQIPEIEGGALKSTPGHGWASLNDVVATEQVKPTKNEVAYSMLGFRNTLVFYTFEKQNVVLKILIDNQDQSFPLSCDLYQFAPTTTEQNLKNWINNQHSDAIFPEVPQPIFTKKLPKGFCKVTASEEIRAHDNPGPVPGKFTEFKVQYSVKARNVGKNIKIPTFADSAKVFVQTK